MPYDYAPFPYARAPGLDAPEPRHPVVIVGAGPIGLAFALELANHGTPSVLLDDDDTVSVGSRAICWSKRSLEIMERLGAGDLNVGRRAAAKGVGWKVGRTYRGEDQVFEFDLLPEEGHRFPAFVNLQQYWVEQYMAEAALAEPLCDLRFRSRVTALEDHGDYVALTVETPDGTYDLEAGHVAACDGARSPIRRMMGLCLAGEAFDERFLIADIEMRSDFPPERRFWFEPTFHPGQSALMHRQPDDIYRIDLQLGPDADPEAEAREDVVRPRIERVIGHSDFRLDWVSIYSFRCQRLERFVHGRVVFAGDSAHVVSPFGARGGNGGLQDVDALGWRLARVANGADPSILAAYDRERVFASDENIAHSARATRFMTPEPGAERRYRDAVLHLAGRADFARPLVNSGRLSTPCVYPSGGPDDPSLPEASRPGAVAPDAPLRDGWLQPLLAGRFTVLGVGCAAPEVEGAEALEIPAEGAVAARYLGDAPSALYLLRPDQVVAARWREADAVEVRAALDGALS